MKVVLDMLRRARADANEREALVAAALARIEWICAATDDSHDARTRAESAFAFTADLQQLTAMLLIAESREDIARIVVREGSRVFGAEGASVYVREGEQLLLLAAEGLAADVRDRYATIPLTSNLPMCDVFAAGEEHWYQSAAEIAHRYPSLLRDLAASRYQARAFLPLKVAGSPFGVLVADFGQVRAFDEAERQKLRTLASLCAQAMDRARLLKAERDARRFQQRLIGTVSHDLRTPLGAVLLGCSLLAQGHLDESQRQSLSRIRHAAERMDRIVRELVEYTHSVTSGGMPAELAPVDLDEICKRVLSAVTPAGRVVYEHGADGTAFWDGALIERLLENLVTNALRYGAPETPVEVRWHDEGERLVLKVHNSGEPIPTDLLPRIFDPFRRGTDRRGNEGLGLGLYIVRQIVDAHEGEVSVRSTAEEGTTFAVTMPRVPKKRPPLKSA